MNFKSGTSPFIRDNDATVIRMMRNVLIALIPVVGSALFVYKLDYLLVLIASLVAVLIPEIIDNKIRKQENTIANFSAMITAVIYSLTLPVGIQLWIVILGGVFAILFAKILFGGLGNNIFNPAVIGRVFILISFGGVTNIPTDVVDGVASATPMGAFANEAAGMIGSVNLAAVQGDYSLSQLFFGGSIGAYGEVFRFAIILGAIWLIYTKAADFRVMASSLLMFFVMAILYGIGNGLPSSFALYQLLSGGLLFGCVFMATDPVTGPATRPSRVVFGLLIGGITFIIRIYGAYVEGMAFAILIMNMFAPLLDYSGWVSSKYTKGWLITITVICTTLGTIALFVS